MREIKFRGRDKQGIWHYGYFWRNTQGDCFIREKIATTHNADFEVDEKSVGQFTGLKDKNGKEIYEGDIVKFVYWVEGKQIKSIMVIRFEDAKFNAFDKLNLKLCSLSNEVANNKIEIIGNIYENPELLGEEK